MKLLKLIPFLLVSSLYAAPFASSTTNVTNWNPGGHGIPQHLSSHHHFYISNDTPGDKIFYFTFKLCVNDFKDCMIKQDMMGLAQGQNYTKDLDLDFSHTFNTLGDHSIIAYTTITGAAINETFDQKYMWIQ
ncbi:MAG TPA: hypothetical protein VK559_04735 [Ferruginibacter sp.]|nr:hypothetical protein [Ferruginibacter sp.]